ncbi:unnamed protein product [Ectocarpus sp. 4 AP-2014]
MTCFKRYVAVPFSAYISTIYVPNNSSRRAPSCGLPSVKISHCLKTASRHGVHRNTRRRDSKWDGKATQPTPFHERQRRRRRRWDRRPFPIHLAEKTNEGLAPPGR